MSKKEEKSEWEQTCDKVHEELDRAITHLYIGLFSQKAKSPFYSRIFQSLSRRITTKDTSSISISLKKTGFSILLNPKFVLQFVEVKGKRRF